MTDQTEYPGIVADLDGTAGTYRNTSESLAGFAIAYALLDVADAIRAGKDQT